MQINMGASKGAPTPTEVRWNYSDMMTVFLFSCPNCCEHFGIAKLSLSLL